MTQTVEDLVSTETGLKKLDFSFVLPSNTRESVDNGFSFMPLNLSESEGTVGFKWFRQAFRITLYQKYYKKAAQEKVFVLYELVEKILNKIYTDTRITGDDYQVVLIDSVQTSEPDVSDTYVAIDLEFSAQYRRTKLFDGR